MKPKKVLVTGSSGFIGSHVADALEHNGIPVVLFDTVPSNYKSKYQKEIIGDILNSVDVERAVEGCDAIYHFAAQADIDYSCKEPLNTITANIIGTQNILEAARKYKVDRFLFASTIYVYSDLGSFYRVSKQACEKIIEEYQNEYGLNYTILRFGSLYGPRANQFNTIRSFLMQALGNKKIIRKGNGEEIREYIHVQDAAQLAYEALSHDFENTHLIITGNQQIKVKDLLAMIKEMFQDEIEIEFGVEQDFNHYEITPYNYKPQVAKKLTTHTFYDLGQGIMDQIYELGIDIKSRNKMDKISLRKRNK